MKGLKRFLVERKDIKAYVLQFTTLEADKVRAINEILTVAARNGVPIRYIQLGQEVVNGVPLTVGQVVIDNHLPRDTIEHHFSRLLKRSLLLVERTEHRVLTSAHFLPAIGGINGHDSTLPSPAMDLVRSYRERALA